MKKVRIIFSGSVDLTTDQCNAYNQPMDPEGAAQEVLETVKHYGATELLGSAWNLADCLNVDVQVVEAGE